jgi:hypothetical protein
MLCQYNHSELTLKALIQKQYRVSTGVLFVSLILIGIGNGKRQDRTIKIDYANDGRTHALGAGVFNLSAVYLTSMIIALFHNMLIAVYPTLILTNKGTALRKSNEIRWIILLLTLPILLAITVVGVAGLTDGWAVFAIVVLTICTLVLLWVMEVSKTPTCQMSVALGSFALMGTIFWIFVYIATESKNIFSLTFSTLMVILMLVMFGKGHTDKNLLRREALLHSSTVLIQIGIPWMWVAGNVELTETSSILRIWGIYVVITLLLTATVVWINRLPTHLIDSNDFHPLHNPLLTVDNSTKEEDDDSDDPYASGENEVIIDQGDNELHTL